MKKINLILLVTLFTVSLITSCSKSSSTDDITSVEISLKDAIGVAKSNFTVYQISDTKYNLYGTDVFFSDQQSVSDANGKATFKIADIDFSTGGQRTYYFFCKYTLNSQNKTKTVGVTLSQYDKKTNTLILN